MNKKTGKREYRKWLMVLPALLPVLFFFRLIFIFEEIKGASDIKVFMYEVVLLAVEYLIMTCVCVMLCREIRRLSKLLQEADLMIETQMKEKQLMADDNMFGPLDRGIYMQQEYDYKETSDTGSKFVTHTIGDSQVESGKVLIVDDSMTNLKLLSAFLRKMRIDASMAMSGKEAVAAVQREKYALILMDRMMKGKDGLETVKEIRQLNGAYYQNVPIVDVLSMGMEQQEMESNKKYYQACLTKPINYELLQQVMLTYGLYKEEQTGA